MVKVIVPNENLTRMKKSARLKTRTVVEGYGELDTEVDKAPTSRFSTRKPVHVVVVIAAPNRFSIRMLDVKDAFLQARMGEDDPPVYVIPPQRIPVI